MPRLVSYLLVTPFHLVSRLKRGRPSRLDSAHGVQPDMINNRNGTVGCESAVDAEESSTASFLLSWPWVFYISLCLRLYNSLSLSHTCISVCLTPSPLPSVSLSRPRPVLLSLLPPVSVHIHLALPPPLHRSLPFTPSCWVRAVSATNADVVTCF